MMYQQSLEEELTPISRRAPLSDAEKLRKVIRELVDTERTYVEVRYTHVLLLFLFPFPSFFFRPLPLYPDVFLDVPVIELKQGGKKEMFLLSLLVKEETSRTLHFSPFSSL